MASSKQIKCWITVKKKSTAKLEKELSATKTRVKKLEGDLKKAEAKEKAAAKKKPAKKKAAPKKKAVAKKKAKK